MTESQGTFSQGPSQPLPRDGYLQALGLPPKTETGGIMDIGTPELYEIAYGMRAHELGGGSTAAGTGKLAFSWNYRCPITPITHGTEFIEGHRRKPGPPPTPSKAVMDEIRSVRERLRAEHGSTPPEPLATQDLPPSANR